MHENCNFRCRRSPSIFSLCAITSLLYNERIVDTRPYLPLIIYVQLLYADGGREPFAFDPWRSRGPGVVHQALSKDEVVVQAAGSSRKRACPLRACFDT